MSKQYSHDELSDALLLMHVYLDAATIPFFLDRSTLYSIMNHKALQGSITLGVLRADAMDTALSILYEQESPVEIKENMILFNVSGVPVSIKIYESNDSMLKNTDTIFWGYDTWRIPNPYKKFWEMRNEIT